MRVKQNDCERFRWKVSCVFKFPQATYLVNTRISTNVKTTICDNRFTSKYILSHSSSWTYMNTRVGFMSQWHKLG